MRRSQNLALRSVQFLAHFTSFYFEILSYLACGEKIIRLESKNSVKLDEKSSDMLQDTPFLLSLYIYKIFRGMRGGGGGAGALVRGWALVRINTVCILKLQQFCCPC